jgi:hypothetical protein
MVFSGSSDANEYTITLGRPLDIIVTSCPLTGQTCENVIALGRIFRTYNFYQSAQSSQLDGER